MSTGSMLGCCAPNLHKKTSNSSSKTHEAVAPCTWKYLGVFHRFRITFDKVITFGRAPANEF